MTCLSAQQLRALSAAAGVVGRPHLRAGLLLTLAVACGPVTDDASDESTSDDPASTSGSTTATSTTLELTTTIDSSDTGGSAGGTATSSDDLTTSGGTLLTEVMTTGDTGDLTTGDTGSSDTGELEDCIDPATLEVDWACCEAQNWEPFPQCTPWGPPAPPALSRDLLARARAARLELA